LYLHLVFFSFIAIANFTQRHILSISLNDVRTEKDFWDIFNSEYINGKRIAFKKRVYVLEDIDYFKGEGGYSSNSEIYSKVSSTKKDTVSDSGDNKEIEPHKRWQAVTKTVNFKPNYKSESTSVRSMNFTRLINMIDQIMEREDIMVVINTRSPEWLEGIFTQPGVINVTLS
jgi:hypothetical protein